MSAPARPSSSLLPTSEPAAAGIGATGRPPLAPLPVAQAGASDPAGASLPLDSRQLLQGRRELQIRHQGEIYRLQQTRQGKLILTK